MVDQRGEARAIRFRQIRIEEDRQHRAIVAGLADEPAYGAAEREGLVFVQGDALDLPVDDDTFDAATIAYGMRNEGVRNETSLAVMFASPTLNIIVLAMMFSLRLRSPAV